MVNQYVHCATTVPRNMFIARELDLTGRLRLDLDLDRLIEKQLAADVETGKLPGIREFS